jgi:LPXTG-site transpeptidase (sortase) family protein
MKSGNFCITGHNYKGIFRELRTLEIGDEFYLIGKDGRKVTYVIYEKYSMDPKNTQAEEKVLNPETNGKRVVTLITCDPGAVTRLILKAEEKN